MKVLANLELKIANSVRPIRQKLVSADTEYSADNSRKFQHKIATT